MFASDSTNQLTGSLADRSNYHLACRAAKMDKPRAGWTSKKKSSHRVIFRCTALIAVVAATTLGLSSNVHGQSRWSDSRDRGEGFNSSAWQGSGWLENNLVERHDWQLGIIGDNTATGVLVREVQPGSAAAKRRIEIGDRILTVNGFQVGLVDGRLYDLAKEINRRADRSGTVTLLIQDHRNGRLAAVQTQLQALESTLRGNLLLPRQFDLPSDAIVTVQIQNISRPHYVVRNGQTSFQPNRYGNIPFEIAYDSSTVISQDLYEVRAFVTSGGRTILDTPRPRRVLTRGNPNEVRLNLQPSQSVPVAASEGSNNVITAGYPNYNSLDAQLKTLYRKYLHRDPTFLELAALHATPGIEQRLGSFPIDLMAGQEYFDSVGNNNSAWLEAVFTEVVGRRPSQSEMELWMRRYSDLRFSRTELLRQLYSQVP